MPSGSLRLVEDGLAAGDTDASALADRLDERAWEAEPDRPEEAERFFLAARHAAAIARARPGATGPHAVHEAICEAICEAIYEAAHATPDAPAFCRDVLRFVERS